MKNKFTIILITLVCANLSIAQTIVAVDKINNDFFGYNLENGEYIDLKLDASNNTSYQYISIAKFSENLCFVGLTKQNVDGTIEPMIIRYDLNQKTYDQIELDQIGLPSAIEVDKINNKIYWIDTGLDIMNQANFDGSNIESVITNGDFNVLDVKSTFFVDAEFNRIYFSYGNWEIFLASLDEFQFSSLSLMISQAPTTLNGAGSISDLIFDEDDAYFYFAQNTFDDKPYIVRKETAPGSGGDEEIIYSSADNELDEMFYYQDRIYWTDGSSNLYSMERDGSNVKMDLETSNIIEDFIICETTLTSIAGINSESPKIYPNPVINDLNISFDSRVYISYSIMNSNGIMIENYREIHNSKINLEPLVNGVYFLILHSKKGNSKIEKFVKTDH